MFAFVLRRILSLVIVLFCVVTITFFLVRLAPGNPFSRERKIPEAIEKQLMARYKLDGTTGRNVARSIATKRHASPETKEWMGQAGSMLDQYLSYLSDITGIVLLQVDKKDHRLKWHFEWHFPDLRISTKYRDRSVNELIADGFPVSATLGLAAFLLATTMGVWLGSLAAVRQHSVVDTGAMFAALLLISIPTFVIGPLLILFFALKIPAFPVGGWNSVSSIVLPAITLAGPYIAYVARLMRSSMLEVLSQDFIRTARAKGLDDSGVIYRHALKVAVLPVVSYLGPLAANLLTGSIIVESIFNIPGMGGYFINSILNRDVFLINGVVLVYCTLLVVLNLFVDVAYTFLDRRIKLYE